MVQLQHKICGMASSVLLKSGKSVTTSFTPIYEYGVEKTSKLSKQGKGWLQNG